MRDYFISTEDRRTKGFGLDDKIATHFLTYCKSKQGTKTKDYNSKWRGWFHTGYSLSNPRFNSTYSEFFILYHYNTPILQIDLRNVKAEVITEHYNRTAYRGSISDTQGINKALSVLLPSVKLKKRQIISAN